MGKPNLQSKSNQMDQSRPMYVCLSVAPDGNFNVDASRVVGKSTPTTLAILVQCLESGLRVPRLLPPSY
jgi:hypothetical protein